MLKAKVQTIDKYLTEHHIKNDQIIPSTQRLPTEIFLVSSQSSKLNELILCQLFAHIYFLNPEWCDLS